MTDRDPIHPMTRREYEAEIRALTDDNFSLLTQLQEAERVADNLRAEKAAAEAERGEIALRWTKLYGVACQERDALQTDLQRVREELKKYGFHFIGCKHWPDPNECSCGLTKALTGHATGGVVPICSRCDGAIDPQMQGGYVEQIALGYVRIPYHRRCWDENEHALDGVKP